MTLSPEYEEDYESFLGSKDSGLLYYCSRYRRFIEELLRCNSSYWIARENGAITGVFPIMWHDGRWGRVVNSLPYFGSHGGILASTDGASRALRSKFSELIEDEEILSAVVVENPLEPMGEEEVKFDCLDERVSQITPLYSEDGHDEGILPRIDSSARRNVRKAFKSSVEVQVENDMLGFLEQVHRENLEEIGGLAKEPRFFTGIQEHFRPGTDYDVFVARVEKCPIAALLVFYFGRTVEYFTPVTVAKYRSIQPMAAILARAMRDSARNGYTRWNWGGTWLTQTGVWRFKRKWGAVDRRYRYFVRVGDKSVFEREKQDLLDAYPGFFVVPFHELKIQ